MRAEEVIAGRAGKKIYRGEKSQRTVFTEQEYIWKMDGVFHRLPPGEDNKAGGSQRQRDGEKPRRANGAGSKVTAKRPPFGEG